MIDQFISDYASVRPSPTIVPHPVRNGKTGKSVGGNGKDTMFVASLKDEDQVHSVRSSMEKGLVSYA